MEIKNAEHVKSLATEKMNKWLVTTDSNNEDDVVFVSEYTEDQCSIECTEKNDVNYKALLELETMAVIYTLEKFECPICLTDINPGHGIILKECLHNFCVSCLNVLIEGCEDVNVKCPYSDESYNCEMILTEREIRHLISPESFEKYLERTIRYAEQKMEYTFHCQTPDCIGWCVYDPNCTIFTCFICKKVNCISCKAIHEGQDCRSYQDLMNIAIDSAGRETKKKLEDLLKSGEGMQCPNCRIVITRIEGCDGMMCSLCKTEICWATKQRRWGPNGKNDISGGCRCNVNNIKCHPNCRNCH